MAEIFYKCNSCGHVFSENDIHYHTIIESTYSHGPKSYDIGYDACPECDSDDFEEVLACSICGEYHSEYDMVDGDDNYYCQDCVDKSLTIKNVELFDEKMIEDGMDGAGGIDPTIVSLLGGSRKVNMILCRVAEESNFGMEDIRKALDNNLDVFMDVVSEENDK